MGKGELLRTGRNWKGSCRWISLQRLGKEREGMGRVERGGRARSAPRGVPKCMLCGFRRRLW